MILSLVLSKGSVAHLGPDDLRVLVEFQVNERPEGLARSKIGFLVRQDVDYGMMRMLGAFLPEDMLDDHVFRDADAAWRWLKA